MGQTVNLLAYAFGGSNPSLPTRKERQTAMFASLFVCLTGVGFPACINWWIANKEVNLRYILKNRFL